VRLHHEGKDVINVYRCTDAVVDIQGFTGSDEFGPQPAIHRRRSYELASATGNRVILMPQSWGPFENPVVRENVSALVRLADVVFARERQSLEYLADLPGVDVGRVVLAPDIAFQFRSDPPEAGQMLLAGHGLPPGRRPLVGITPNMRIVERTHGKAGDNVYFRSLVEISRFFLDETDCGLVLIPHEHTPGRANDPELCASLAASLDAPDRVISLTGQESAASIKSLIGQLEFLVASRYHSLVAAISMRTPVAVIGWSHKYDELMQRAGLAEWIVDPARRPDVTAQEVVLAAWQDRDRIRASMLRHVPELEQASRSAVERMLDELAPMSAR
jgi:colanic acid/amylovoran biosynthesis protein